MKKLLSWTIICSILCSQTGCVGDQSSTSKNNSDIPYATLEIKEKLAKRINPKLEQIPDDFFEKLNYNILLQKILTEASQENPNPLQILGDTTEEQVFWYYIMRLRLLSTYLAFPRDIDDPGFVIEWLNMLAAPLQEFIEKNPEKSQQIIADVIRYENTYPYLPIYSKAEINTMTKESLIQRFGFSDEEITPDIVEEFKKEQREETEDFPLENFQKIRKQLLEGYQETILQIQSGKTPEEYAEEQKNKAGITEYAIHFQASELYPVELVFAEFALDKEEQEWYEFPKLFLRNASSINSARIENESPLPYSLDLMWYAIAENKVYSLETSLPREELLEKLMGDDNKPWDALLFTLEPYGKVTLFAFNQITEKKEKLAQYQAKEETMELNDFRQFGVSYESPAEPAQTWQEYQQKALKAHPKAAKI